MATQTETKVRAQLEAEVKGLGKVFYVVAPFDQSLEALRNVGVDKPISLRDLAYARIQTADINHSLNQNGSYVLQSGIYRPRSNEVSLVKISPILSFPEEATNAHRAKREFYESNKAIKEAFEKSLESSIKSPYDKKPIPTDQFDEYNLTRWAFEDQAKDYGLFLKENGIDEMPVLLVPEDYVDMQEKPFVTQLWLSRLYYYVSGLDGSGRGYDGVLAGGSWLRGVSRSGVSAEGAS